MGAVAWLSASVWTVGAETPVAGFARISDQSSYPFQVNGMIVAPGTNWSHMARHIEPVVVPAMLARPGLLSCVTSDQPVSPVAFDWAGMESDAALRVCLFHAFASVGSAKNIAAWLAHEGLAQELDGSQSLPGTAYNRPDSPVHLHSFRWDTAIYGPLFGPRRGDPAAGRGILHSTITYALDQDGMPLDVVIFHQGTWLK